MRPNYEAQKILEKIERYNQDIRSGKDNDHNNYFKAYELMKLLGEKKADRYDGEISSDEILECISTAIKKNSANPKYFATRCQFYIDLGNIALAEQDLQQAKLLMPTLSERETFAARDIVRRSEEKLKLIRQTSIQVERASATIAPDQTPAVQLPSSVKSPQRNYDDIKAISTALLFYEDDIIEKGKSIDRDFHCQRVMLLLKLWKEKKAGRYPGELSAEHVLKSITVVINRDQNDPEYWLERGNFYAQLGDRANAVADFEKAKSLPMPEDVLSAYACRNKFTDLEAAIKTLPVTEAAETQPLAPLTIDEIKIQKLHREIALFDMQLAMTPNHAESLISKAYAFSQLAGLLQWETSVAEKVTKAYDAAIQCAPNTYLYLRRAGSHLKRNNFGPALQDIYDGTGMSHQPNMKENILKYIDAILIGNYKGDAGLQNAFEKFRVEKNIPETTAEAWFNTLAAKYRPVVSEDTTKREIQLQRLCELEKKLEVMERKNAELMVQLRSVQGGLGGSSALFAKKDAQTQTVEAIAAPNPHGFNP